MAWRLIQNMVKWEPENRVQMETNKEFVGDETIYGIVLAIRFVPSWVTLRARWVTLETQLIVWMEGLYRIEK